MICGAPSPSPFLKHGMGIKTLGTVIGHVSSATTLNAYTHIVDAMWHSTSD